MTALARATRAGRKAIAVVASAGSTATGAFDPLEPVADFAQAHGLWFHVDGAHGAAASLSPKYRAQVKGIERADSVVWDAHKGLLMPALVTAVLFRDGARSFDAFSQEAHYLFHGDGDDARPYSDVGLRTLECTKEMMPLKVYACGDARRRPGLRAGPGARLQHRLLPPHPRARAAGGLGRAPGPPA